MMTNEQINAMADKAMMSLYNAVMNDKITTVQGMCQVIKAVSKYNDLHHSMHDEYQEDTL